MSNKRRILKRAGLMGLAVAIGAGTWLVAGQSISLLVDQIGTVKVKSLPVSPLVALNGEMNSYHGGKIRIGDQEMANAGMDLIAFPLRFQPDGSGKLRLVAVGKSFVLGPIASEGRDDGGSLIHEFKPETGDEVTFTLDRSALSWTSPLNINFMTGAPSSTWGRTVYYRLRWKKSSGANLEMDWMFQQHYDDSGGWRPAWTKGGSGGLLRVEIRP